MLALLIVFGLALAGSFLSGRFRFRWSWTDAFVVALMFLVAISATHAIDRRPALNLAWEWAAMGFAYVLLRNLPRTRNETSALAGAIVATAFAVSCYGLYQVKVELPILQARFIANPVRVMQEMGIAPGPRSLDMVRDRLARLERAVFDVWPAQFARGLHRRTSGTGPCGRIPELGTP